MKEKPQVHIGTIGCVDHSKHTLMEAIKIVLELEKNKEQDSNKLDIVTRDEGGFNMIKGFRNYTGSTILGYRFVLNNDNTSKKRKFVKGSNNIKDKTFKGKTKILKRNFLGK